MGRKRADWIRPYMISSLAPSTESAPSRLNPFFDGSSPTGKPALNGPSNAPIFEADRAVPWGYEKIGGQLPAVQTRAINFRLDNNICRKASHHLSTRPLIHQLVGLHLTNQSRFL